MQLKLARNARTDPTVNLFLHLTGILEQDHKKPKLLQLAKQPLSNPIQSKRSNIKVTGWKPLDNCYSY